MIEAEANSRADYGGTVPDHADAGRETLPLRSFGLLLFLLAAYACSWMDRALVVILNEPMRRDLHLTDTQLGLISGFAFSLIYSLAAFPIGQLVDRGARKTIFLTIVALFSGATMLASVAKGFATLAISRVLVAAAESGLSPAAFSMISDAFPKQWRGRAVSIYSLGLSLGMWLGLALGGLIADRLGWRAAFILVAMPGLLLALIGLVWIREPRRGAFDQTREQDEQFTFIEGLSFLVRKRAFFASALAFGLLTITTGAFEVWVPAYLIRMRGLDATTVGSMSGAFAGIGGFISTILFGFLADVLGRRDLRWYIWLSIIGTLLFIPAEVLFFYSDGMPSYILYFVAICANTSYVSPLFALGQILLPPRLRALGTAMMMCTLNLIGMGGGTFGAGLISDFLQSRGSTNSLAEAVQILQLGAVLGLIALVFAAIFIKRDEKYSFSTI